MKVAVEKEAEVADFLSTLIINNDSDLDQMVEYAEHLADKLDTGDKTIEPLFDYLTGIIEVYENKHYPIPNVSPSGMLRYLMDQYGHKQKDMTDVASRTVISEILIGRRELTKTHISRLAKKYHVSPDLFF